MQRSLLISAESDRKARVTPGWEWVPWSKLVQMLTSATEETTSKSARRRPLMGPNVSEWWPVAHCYVCTGFVCRSYMDNLESAVFEKEIKDCRRNTHNELMHTCAEQHAGAKYRSPTRPASLPCKALECSWSN